MKWSWKNIFDDSSLYEEDDNDFEFASAIVATDEDFRRPWCVSQIGRWLLPQDQVMGHDGLVRDYFSPDAVYSRCYFPRQSGCIGLSSRPLQRLWRDMTHGLSHILWYVSLSQWYQCSPSSSSFCNVCCWWQFTFQLCCQWQWVQHGLLPYRWHLSSMGHNC